MKKMKKFLAGLLTLAMTVATVAIQTPMTAKAAQIPTIDTTKKGSLTIHKYEYNGTGGTGTGSSTDLNNGVLNGNINVGDANDSSKNDPAIPLPNVTFRVTYVADLDDYYGPEDAALPTVESLTNDTSGTYKDTYYNDANNKVDTIATVGQWKEVTTTTDGTANLTDLPLGIYLVQEISAPAQITGKVADFLVSIPMTNADENDWKYDVHVFPKNKSTYAGISLLKQGKIGDDADDAVAVLQGATFVLQLKGTDGKWTTVTANNKGEAVGTDGVLTTDATGVISVDNLAPGEYRFVETGVPEDSGYIMDGTTVYEFTIAGAAGMDTDNTSYEMGAVLIGGKVSTDANNFTVTNYKPDVEKQVKNRDVASTETNDTKIWDNDSDYSVGDVVPYRIKVDVPANVADLVEFTLSDTMDNQTYKVDSLKIYKEAALETEILANQYTVDTATSAWSIAFNTATNVGKTDQTITSILKDYAGKSIYIYFEATLNDDAVVTAEGNDNTVKLSYSNEILPSTQDGNPNEPTDPDNPDAPSSDVITDQATAYTFKIAVEKVDGTDTNTKLQGVMFDLYRKVGAVEDTKLIPAANLKTDPVSGLTGQYELVKKDLTTDNKGKVTVNGLENGEYYLVETQTNDGYNLLKEPVKVEIAVTYTTKTTTTIVTDATGVTTKTTVVENETFSGGDTDNNGTYTTQIKNNKGFTLPTTGGVGTYIFVFVGVSMMAAAVILFFTTKKKEA